MQVEQIMSANPVTVGLDDRLWRVKEIFDNHKFHHLLVVDDGRLVGVLSDRDVLRWVSPHVGTNRVTVNDLSTLDIPVHRVVTRKLVTLAPEADVFDAVDVFNRHNISCIPIVDGEGAPIGIISWRDVMKLLKRPATKTD